MVNKTLGIFRAWDSISPTQVRSKGQPGCVEYVEITQKTGNRQVSAYGLARGGDASGLQCWCGREQSQRGGAPRQSPVQQVCNRDNHQQPETGVKLTRSIIWVHPYPYNRVCICFINGQHCFLAKSVHRPGEWSVYQSQQ